MRQQVRKALQTVFHKLEVRLPIARLRVAAQHCERPNGLADELFLKRIRDAGMHALVQESPKDSTSLQVVSRLGIMSSHCTKSLCGLALQDEALGLAEAEGRCQVVAKDKLQRGPGSMKQT